MKMLSCVLAIWVNYLHRKGSNCINSIDNGLRDLGFKGKGNLGQLSWMPIKQKIKECFLVMTIKEPTLYGVGLINS